MNQPANPTSRQSQPGEETTAPSQRVDNVLAEVEFRQFSRLTGERISKPFNQYYNPEEWTALQVHGPRMGLFVNKIIEAPEGTDLEYKNPK